MEPARFLDPGNQELEESVPRGLGLAVHTRRMRVLQLISSAGHYGAENMLLNLSQSLQRLGCEITVGVFYNTHRPNTELADQARAHGLPVVMIRCEGRADREAARAIAEAIRANQIELVHSHGYKADLYGFTVAKDLGVPILATCHNWPDKNLPLWVYSVLDRLMLRRFPQIVAVSENVRAALRRFGIPLSRISILGNGIDLEPFRAASPTLAAEIRKGDRLVVGLVGRLVPAKGPEYFLQAAREVLKRFPKTLFIFVGEGPEHRRLEKLTRELGIEHNVNFVGQRRDMPGVYSSLDVLALPSLTEGLPMTILEALAAKRAVVATRVGAIPDVVLHERTGLLIEPRDVSALQHALERLLGDAALRLRLGEAGCALVRQKFSAEAMARNYLDLYQRLVLERAA